MNSGAGFATLNTEYRTVEAGPAIVDRPCRWLLEIEGADRAEWLHNLTSNQVKMLSPGEGNYAFVLNVQGRILFDINLFIRPNSIWIDLDRRFVETAKKHFSKYTITERVTLTDRTAEFSRLGLIGGRCGKLLASLFHAALDLVEDLSPHRRGRVPPPLEGPRRRLTGLGGLGRR